MNKIILWALRVFLLFDAVTFLPIDMLVVGKEKAINDWKLMWREETRG